MTQIVATDIRWRSASDLGEGAWITRRLAPGEALTLRELERGVEYEVQARNIGANGRASAWVSRTITVPETNRRGASALPVNAVGNIPSVWDVDTEVTFSASTDGGGDSTATISASAGTLVIGGQTVTYGASSGTVTGTGGTTKRVFLYYDDPRLQGGSRTLGITDSFITSMSGNGRVAITNLLIEFPGIGAPPNTGGGGIGGGGGGGGAGSCPSVDAWVVERGRGLILAGDVCAGDWLLLCDPDDGQESWGEVTHSVRARVPGVRIVTDSLAALSCSTTAPIPTDHGYRLAPDTYGCRVRIRARPAERVVDIVSLGEIDVQEITVGDRCFWVGDSPAALLLHHNVKNAEEPL